MFQERTSAEHGIDIPSSWLKEKLVLYINFTFHGIEVLCTNLSSYLSQTSQPWQLVVVESVMPIRLV